MNGLEAFLKLTEHGRPKKEAPTRRNPREGLVDLLEYAHTSGRLETDSAWRLAASESRTLETRTGYSPPGGWGGLAALAAGRGILRATHEGFDPLSPVEQLASEAPEDCQRKMIEAFTTRLVPPGAAAGLFVLLGLHPMWGLRLAEDCGAPTSTRWRDESILPPALLAVARIATFGTLAAIIATLRTLDPNQEYPVDALPDLVLAACETARGMAEDTAPEAQPGALPLFLSEVASKESMRRVRDLTLYDLIDGVFLPAGAIQRSDRGMFWVTEGAFDGVRVGDMEEAQQEPWLGWLTALEPRFLVA